MSRAAARGVPRSVQTGVDQPEQGERFGEGDRGDGESKRFRVSYPGSSADMQDLGWLGGDFRRPLTKDLPLETNFRTGTAGACHSVTVMFPPTGSGAYVPGTADGVTVIDIGIAMLDNTDVADCTTA